MSTSRSTMQTRFMPQRMDLLANPYAPSLHVLEALSSDDQYRRSTPVLYGSLIERIADRETISPDWIALGAGVDDLLIAIMRAFGHGENLVLFPPTDDRVAELAERLGQTPVLVPRSSRFALDLDRPGLPAFPPVALSIVQHPNDPTGTPVTVQEAVRLIRRSRLLVVDERHAGYGARSLLPLVREFDRIIVLRTFETWAGLTALPLAVAIGAPEAINRLREHQLIDPPAAALVAAHASMDDQVTLDRGIHRVREEKARLYRMLRKMNMLSPYPSWANFILAQVE
ncbi:MAG TPA: aminotransferase class I/II-fold pyridoxal phosphate-dependent enzyme, partial [Thermomicrobiales bacterium]|nr:aminotransferase class I/II-fold pyridoxal phosphate-dependent enzyme [Thermomicrobiales bacterium]